MVKVWWWWQWQCYNNHNSTDDNTNNVNDSIGMITRTIILIVKTNRKTTVSNSSSNGNEYLTPTTNKSIFYGSATSSYGDKHDNMIMAVIVEVCIQCEFEPVIDNCISCLECHWHKGAWSWRQNGSCSMRVAAPGRITSSTADGQTREPQPEHLFWRVFMLDGLSCAISKACCALEVSNYLFFWPVHRDSGN